MQQKDVWKFSTTDLGEQSVIIVSLTMRQRLLAMDSASGMLFRAILLNAPPQYLWNG